MSNYLSILCDASNSSIPETVCTQCAQSNEFGWNDWLTIILAVLAFLVSLVPFIYHLISPSLRIKYLEPNDKLLDPAAYSGSIINPPAFHFYHLLVSQRCGIKPLEESIVMLDSIIYDNQQVFINVPLRWMNQEEYPEDLTTRTILRKYQAIDLFKENIGSKDISLVSSNNKSYFIDDFNKATNSDKKISFVIVVDSKTKIHNPKWKITISKNPKALPTDRSYTIKIKKVKSNKI